MIEVTHLHKSFNGRLILNDINIVFEQGKTNIIIGESGSGKTVLLKCMVALHEVDSGKVFYSGKDFTAMDQNERKQIRQEIGMLFQGGALFDSQTVAQNVMFPLSMFSSMSEKEKKDRVDFCLERVNLSHAHQLYPSEISGGMKKRVAIARAIAMQPKYLFCDEPNSGLDPRTSILIDNLISEITEEFNMTTVVITHDMNSVIEIGDSISFLYKGEIAWKGNKNNILTAENQRVREFVQANKFVLQTRS
jgi:phospholipid/cholesterol/gamma-HCH transport system ATP-binding protein